VYRANFEHDQDISAPETVAACLRNAGQEPGPILSASESPEAKDRLRKQSEEAFQLGIFGAPSFAVGAELFWGNDRLERAVAWCVENAARQDTAADFTLAAPANGGAV
jgi:2-hydroxychromene-2-carboxylate isomerase